MQRRGLKSDLSQSAPPPPLPWMMTKPRTEYHAMPVEDRGNQAAAKGG